MKRHFSIFTKSLMLLLSALVFSAPSVFAEDMLTPGWVISDSGGFTELHRPDFPDFRIFVIGLVAPYNADDETAYLKAFDQMKTQWGKGAFCGGLLTAETKEYKGGLVEAWADTDAPQCRLMGLNLAPAGFFGVMIWHPKNLKPTDSAFKSATKAGFETLWDAGFKATGQSGPYRAGLLHLKDPMIGREAPVDYLIVRMKVVVSGVTGKSFGGWEIVNRAFPIYRDGTVLSCSHWDPAFLDKNSQLVSRDINCVRFEIQENLADKSLKMRFSKGQAWEDIFVQLSKLFPGSDRATIDFEDARIGIAKPFTNQTVDFQTEPVSMRPYLDDENYRGAAGSGLYWLSRDDLIVTPEGRFASGSFSALGYEHSDGSIKARGQYKFSDFHVRVDLSSGEKYVGHAAWWDADPSKTQPDDKSHILMFGTVFKPCSGSCGNEDEIDPNAYGYAFELLFGGNK